MALASRSEARLAILSCSSCTRSISKFSAVKGSERDECALQTPDQRDARRSIGSEMAVVDQVEETPDQIDGLPLLCPGWRHVIIMPRPAVPQELMRACLRLRLHKHPSRTPHSRARFRCVFLLNAQRAAWRSERCRS